jgi:hypothetical protein
VSKFIGPEIKCVGWDGMVQTRREGRMNRHARLLASGIARYDPCTLALVG